MTTVLGASVGASGIRGVVLDTAAQRIIATEAVRSHAGSSDGLTAVHQLAGRHAAQSTTAVLGVADSVPEAHDGIILFDEALAQLEALRYDGQLENHNVVALLDLGSSGATCTVLDADTGEVLIWQRTAAAAGDQLERLLYDHLLVTYGAAESLSIDARGRLRNDVRRAKERLSSDRSVTVDGPFLGGQAKLWRNTFDDLVIGEVDQAVALLASLISRAPKPVDVVVPVGGGANLPIVQRLLQEALAVPIVIASAPELLAARGAALIASRTQAEAAPLPPYLTPLPAQPLPAQPLSAQPLSAQPPIDQGPWTDPKLMPVPTAKATAKEPAKVAAKEAEPLAGLPRHSDASSRRVSKERVARQRGSRAPYLGGAVALILAGCVAVGVATAAHRTSDEPQQTNSSNVVSVTTVGAPQTAAVFPAAIAGETPTELPSESVAQPTTDSVAATTTASRASASATASSPARHTPVTKTAAPTTAPTPFVPARAAANDPPAPQTTKAPITTVAPTTTKAPVTTTKPTPTSPTPTSSPAKSTTKLSPTPK